jgi:hypothetical protein
MKKAILLGGLFLMLGGCPAPQNPVVNNTLQPLPTPSPTPWLGVDPVCTGTITRAEWLICDNATLNALHRRLAQQWATARQYASPERMDILEDQLYALLSERDQCQDVACVANAYRRYIDGPVTIPGPTPPPKPKPPVKKPPKWHPKPRHGGGGQVWTSDGGDDRDGPSCAATAGAAEAQRLSRQCDRVTNGRDWSCSPQQSCGALHRNVTKGCNETYRKPDFCPKL